jgi:hypothetical protein
MPQQLLSPLWKEGALYREAQRFLLIGKFDGRG